MNFQPKGANIIFEITYGLARTTAHLLRRARTTSPQDFSLARQAQLVQKDLETFKLTLAAELCSEFDIVRRSFRGHVDNTAVWEVVEARAFGIVELAHNIPKTDIPHVVDVLARAVGLHDDYTYFHSTRVAHLTERMARHPALGFDADTAKALHYASYLHDVGKLAVPSDLLRRVGSFALEEREFFGPLHLLVGYQLLSLIGGELSRSADILLYQHVHDGYPVGLKVEHMSLASKALSAADYYDARTSQRSYNKPMARGPALELIAARNYGPGILEALSDAAGP